MTSYRMVKIDQPIDPGLAFFEDRLAAGEADDLALTRGHRDSEAAPGGGFEARIADSPIAVPLERLFEARNIALPADFAVYRAAYDAWLVPHRVSVMRHHGLSALTELGIRVTYHTVAGSVVSLLPEFQFVEAASLKFCCSSDVYGSLERNQTIANAERVGGGQLKVGSAAHMSTRLAFELSVVTPTISAVGKGSRRAEWSFELNREPLHGRDIETWSILLVPTATVAIEYELVMSLTRRLAFFPTRWESRPLKITCGLA